MTVTEVQFKKTKKRNRPVVCTKSLIPWVNRGPSGSVYLSHLTPPSSLLFVLLLSPWLPYRNPKRSSSPPSQALCTCCCSLPGVFYPWLLAGLPMLLPGVSASLFPSRPKQVSCESLCQSIPLFLFVVCHTVWNYVSIFCIFFSWIDCKLLKSKDYVRSNSPLQPYCPEQGLTHI